jgi:vitamin B12/bleomycin/antimicrobial peptide transport system ATP-binding/permease protein
MLRLPINEQGWGLFTRLIVNFRRSEFGGQAVSLFASLIGLLLVFNALNIVNSYVGRDFMSALADRKTDVFVRQAFFYVLVFAASTGVAVILRYCEERLGLVWRQFMTGQFVDLYVKPPTYYRMNDELIRQSGVEYPDQRIADDVKAFTTTTLSFILMSMNGVFTVVAFSGVLWMISPWLFGAALLYAVIGSYITVRVGAQLVDLNYKQLDKEAAFRSSLIHVRERAESIALLHHESRLKPRLIRQFNELADNFRAIIGVNRNLGTFTTGYNYLIQIIPILLVAPLFIEGRVEFGVVTQSALAFAALVGAFSLIVNQFQSLSSFAAVIQRLINLWYVIELAQTETVSGLDMREEDDEIVYENLTLLSPSDKRVLVKDLSVTIPHGLRVLVMGDDAARDALFKATAGIYDAGMGVVKRPPLDRILFLPERPYVPPGTLRQALAPVHQDSPLTDARIHEVLDLLGVADVIARAGGLDNEHDWDTLLSAREQRFVSFARIMLAAPRFAVMANPGRDLETATRNRIFQLLDQQGITLITMGYVAKRDDDDFAAHYDAVLELGEAGEWIWRKL